MSLVFNNNQNSPQTHVFIVGVGKYDYLKDGINAIKQQFGFLNQLGQLSSPGKSAAAFYSAVMEFHEKNCWLAPLGSIELLMDEDSAPSACDVPTRDNFEQAYWEWRDRCELNTDNIAIFYFSGHGFTKIDKQYLALGDFGENPRNPWKGCVSITDTRTAFHGCKASKQVFLIDACRNVPPETLLNNFDCGSVDTISHMQTTCKHDLTLYAAAPNESAFGRMGEVSYFTTAMLNGLTGLAASNDAEVDGDRWLVNTGNLSTGINKWMAKLTNTEVGKSRCDSRINSPFDMLALAEPPLVDLLVDCDPAPALAHAELECSNEYDRHTRDPKQEPWAVVVKAGLYRISASFPGEQYKPAFLIRSVRPPNSSFKLTV